MTDQDIPLAGWHLSDDPVNPHPWTFPEITLPARGFLVVFASGKNRSGVTNRLHTDFKLKSEGEYLGLSAPDHVILDAFAPRVPATPANTAYGRANGDTSQSGFMATPTPGAPNSVSGVGFAPAVVFSRTGGLIPDPKLNLTIRLSLAQPAQGALIRYSLDGRIPTLTNGFTYTAPLVMVTNNALMLRARAFQTNHLPGPVHTEYHPPCWSRRPERSTEPTPGESRSRKSPTPTSSSSVPISPFWLQWTDDYNQDLELPVLGMPAESEWVLYAPNDFEPVCIHNPFMHQLARDIGEYSPRTRFVEVFINTLGPLTTNQYEGLYVLTEKIGVGSKRIPGPKLQPEDGTLPDITGPIPIDGPVRLVARTLDPLRRQVSGPPISTPWSSPVARTFLFSSPPLTLSEIHFHPSDQRGARSYDPDQSEFLEFKNTSGGPLDLTGFRLEGDVSFTFNTTNGTRILPPNGRVVLVSDNGTFRSRYGTMAEHLGRYSGRLSDGGGRLRLVDPQGDPVFDFELNDQWVPPADGDGYSMVLRSESLLAFEIDTPAAWIASAAPEGSPGQPDLASDVGPGTDSDHDGLGDLWELTFFGSLQPRADDDFDGDGASQREEFLAGTVPTDPSDHPRLEALPSRFDGNPVLRFPRRGARSYRVQFQEALPTTQPPGWRELMEFPAEASPLPGEFRDLSTTNATRFYRIVTP